MMKILKNPPRIIYFLLALSLCFIVYSCQKEEMETELVPITTSGENTMGFYIDGEPVNIQDQNAVLFCESGVSVGVTQEGIIRIFGHSCEPSLSITIDFPKDSIDSTSNVLINEFIYRHEVIRLNTGYSYKCDSFHHGRIEITRMDDFVLAGTFEFEAIHEESGRTIQVMDGRFDIKRN